MWSEIQIVYTSSTLNLDIHFRIGEPPHMLMTTDTVLVRRAALGDREAFVSIYEESFRCIYAFAAREARDRQAAEFLTERILVRVFEALDSYAGDIPFAAWLQSIAKTVVASERPRQRRPSRVAPKPPFAHSAPR